MFLIERTRCTIQSRNDNYQMLLTVLQIDENDFHMPKHLRDNLLNNRQYDSLTEPNTMQTV